MNQSESDDLESIESDLTSLSSSIYNYVYENGRTYHAYRSGAYVGLSIFFLHDADCLGPPKR